MRELPSFSLCVAILVPSLLLSIDVEAAVVDTSEKVVPRDCGANFMDFSNGVYGSMFETQQQLEADHLAEGASANIPGALCRRSGTACCDDSDPAGFVLDATDAKIPLRACWMNLTHDPSWFCNLTEWFVAVPDPSYQTTATATVTPADGTTPTNTATPNKVGIELLRSLDDTARQYWMHVDMLLSRFACRDFYPYHSCDPCRTAYKRWVCASVFPRVCFHPRDGVAVDDGADGSGGDGGGGTGNGTSSGAEQAIIAQRVCKDVCYEVVRKCPTHLQFACPKEDAVYTDPPRCMAMDLVLRSPAVSESVALVSVSVLRRA